MEHAQETAVFLESCIRRNTQHMALKKSLKQCGRSYTKEKNKNMQSYVVNYHHICSCVVTFGFLSVVLVVYAAVEMHLKK